MTRPVRVEKQRTIRAAAPRVFQLLSRVEGWPRYADLWLAADVLERGGGQVVAEFRGYFAGLPVESVQRISLRPPVRLEFRQLRGTFKALRGEYVVEPEGQGARLSARMEVDAGIALLSEQAVRMVLSAALDRLLAKVKDAAERDLPRLVPARRPADTAGHGPLPELPALPSGLGEETAEPAAVEPAATTAAEGPPLAAAEEGAPPASQERTDTPRRRRRRRRHRRRPGGSPERGGPAPA